MGERGNGLPSLWSRSVVWVHEYCESGPPHGGPPLPFCMPKDRGQIHEREWSPGSRFSSSLRVVPVGLVDDDGGVPAPLPSATCDVRLSRAGGMTPSVLGGRRAPRQDGQREPPMRYTA
jgi:hypothetical protein